MHIIILENNASILFAKAQLLEDSCPGGIWRHFKVIDKKTVTAIFEYEKSFQGSLKVHPDFFKYFLGLFSPKLKSCFDFHQEKTFTDFCIKLNGLLNDGRDVYDLSVPKKWIWSDGDEIKIPNRLQSFLDFE